MKKARVCPKCGFSSNTDFSECPRCSVVVEKYLNFLEKNKENGKSGDSVSERMTPGNTASRWARLAEITVLLRKNIFRVAEDMNPIAFWGRVLLFALLIIWGIRFMFSSVASNAAGESFLHLVNLPFHEFGHILFRPFGELITSLGGTLGQLLMPSICMGAFLIRGDAFAASVCLWWIGQNFMDIAPYINDARAGELPLLGGYTGQTADYGFHDWEYILTETGLIRYDHSIALASHAAGIIIMLISFAWAGFLLWKQYRNLDV
ncbi:MAG: zinc ribbon domain-containing protein [Desulfococcaceae bacterium]